MSFCRWIGALLLVVGLFTVTGTLLPVLAQDNKKDEPKKDALKKDDTKKDEPKKDAPKKDDTKKDEPKKDAPKKDEPKKDAPKDTADGLLSNQLFKAFTYDKNKKDAYFIQEVKTKTTQKMKVEKQDVTQVQEQTFTIKWTPLESTGSDLKVEQQIIGVKMDITIGSNKIFYDSTDDKAASPMADFFQALKKGKLIFVIDPETLTVKEVVGRDDFIKLLTEAAPQMKGLLNNILTEDAIQKMAQPCWGAIPNKKEGAKKKGEKWGGTKSKLDLGAIGSYETEFTYEFAKEDKDKIYINIFPKMTYKAPTPGTGKDSLPFTIKETDTKLASVDNPKEPAGEAVFDRKTGRIESSKMNLKLEGKLNIDVGGTETKVDLNQEQISDMTTLANDDARVQKMLGTKK